MGGLAVIEFETLADFELLTETETEFETLADFELLTETEIEFDILDVDVFNKLAL